MITVSGSAFCAPIKPGLSQTGNTERERESALGRKAMELSPLPNGCQLESVFVLAIAIILFCPLSDPAGCCCPHFTGEETEAYRSPS